MQSLRSKWLNGPFLGRNQASVQQVMQSAQKLSDNYSYAITETICVCTLTHHLMSFISHVMKPMQTFGK
eukprot:1763324-Pleurochrysis_carterae.AAC.1